MMFRAEAEAKCGEDVEVERLEVLLAGGRDWIGYVGTS